MSMDHQLSGNISKTILQDFGVEEPTLEPYLTSQIAQAFAT